MKKKWLATLMCGILAIAALTGCGGTGEDGPTAYISQQISQQPEQQTDEQESSIPDETEPSQEDTAQEAEITMNDISPMELVKEMKIGWNLGNTLDATSNSVGVNSEIAWGNPRTTQEMMDAIIDQGFNVIRIPVSWGGHMGGAPEYNILPAWMDRVQEVVDYAYSRGVYVIVNIHHEDWHFPSEENKEAAAEQLAALWTAIATRFRDYDEHLIFEGMNEPRKTGTSVEWNGGDKEGRDVVNYLD
ncbi:MAG: glycoside hydrolase family 5 protein, partial [Acetatifactor sp.]|nr:glycoside hydrolase family 5 protein [Acetatifactor sp.]